MAEVKLYFEDVKEGDETPGWVREQTIANWSRYGAVNDELQMIHMDPDFAKKSTGQRDMFAMGNLRFAYFHNALRDWIGDTGRIKKVGIQFRGFVFRGYVLTTKGKVTKKYVEGGEHLVDLDLEVKNQEGEGLDRGKATVALPSRGN